MNYTEYTGGCVNFGMSNRFLKDYLLEYGKNYNLELMRTHSTVIYYFTKFQLYKTLYYAFNNFRSYENKHDDFELVSRHEFDLLDDLPA